MHYDLYHTLIHHMMMMMMMMMMKYHMPLPVANVSHDKTVGDDDDDDDHMNIYIGRKLQFNSERGND